MRDRRISAVAIGSAVSSAGRTPAACGSGSSRLTATYSLLSSVIVRMFVAPTSPPSCSLNRAGSVDASTRRSTANAISLLVRALKRAAVCSSRLNPTLSVPRSSPVIELGTDTTWMTPPWCGHSDTVSVPSAARLIAPADAALSRRNRSRPASASTRPAGSVTRNRSESICRW